MVAKIRAKRIAEQIQEDLAELLLGTVTDPRLAGVTVTDVTVDRELAYATVYVSALEGSERKEEILEGLHSASGFLRSQLAQQFELRTFPKLRFKWDSTPERAARIDELLTKLAESDDYPEIAPDDRPQEKGSSVDG